METIVSSPFFTNAELSGTTNQNVSGRQLKSFSLTIKVTNADYGEAAAEEEESKG